MSHSLDHDFSRLVAKLRQLTVNHRLRMNGRQCSELDSLQVLHSEIYFLLQGLPKAESPGDEVQR